MSDRKEGDGLEAPSPTVSHGPEGHVVDSSRTHTSPSDRFIPEATPVSKWQSFEEWRDYMEDEKKVTPVGRGPRGEIIMADETRAWCCLVCGCWDTNHEWPDDLDDAEQGNLCSDCAAERLEREDGPDDPDDPHDRMPRL